MVKNEHNIREQSLSSSKPSMSASRMKYKGVRKRSWGSWVSEIRAPNQKTRIWLGSYSTAEAAARAHDAALLSVKGPSAYANLNFPFSIESYHHIIVSHLDRTTAPMSPKSIQRVAAAAAQSAPICTVSPPSSPSPSSLSAMFYSSSSPSDQQADDDASLLQGGLTCDPCGPLEPSKIMMDFWGAGLEGLHSPRFIDDQMLMGEPYGASLVDDVYEEGDIRLWSFC